MTVAQAARDLNVPYGALLLAAKKYRIGFGPAKRGAPSISLEERYCDETLLVARALRKQAADDRANAMAQSYAEGETLEKIGIRWGVTRERARQIIKKHAGITGRDGGRAVAARHRVVVRQKEMDEYKLRQCGATLSQWRHLKKIGDEMVAQGASIHRTPLYRYKSIKRNICKFTEFRMGLWEWWCLWQSSGHWEEAGRGAGHYWMQVIDRSKPVDIGNVRIVLCEEAAR